MGRLSKEVRAQSKGPKPKCNAQLPYPAKPFFNEQEEQTACKNLFEEDGSR